MMIIGSKYSLVQGAAILYGITDNMDIKHELDRLNEDFKHEGKVDAKQLVETLVELKLPYGLGVIANVVSGDEKMEDFDSANSSIIIGKIVRFPVLPDPDPGLTMCAPVDIQDSIEAVKSVLGNVECFYITR